MNSMTGAALTSSERRANSASLVSSADVSGVGAAVVLAGFSVAAPDVAASRGVAFKMGGIVGLEPGTADVDADP